MRTTLLLGTLATALLCTTADAKPTEEIIPHAATMHELVIVSDGSRMPAMMYQAAGDAPNPTIVLLHGLPGNEKNLDIAQEARRHGFNVLFFHYRGAWGAEGDYRLTQLDDDVAAALAFLRDNAKAYNVDVNAITTLGHSMGGFASLLAGSKDDGLKCVGAMSPGNLQAFIDPTTELPYLWLSDYADTLFMLNGFNGEALVDEFKQATPKELDATQFGKGLENKSVLMVVGKEDTVTPLSMFDPMVAAYQQHQDITLSVHRIDGDHSYSASRLELTEIVVAWLNQACR